MPLSPPYLLRLHALRMPPVVSSWRSSCAFFVSCQRSRWPFFH
jgi:hypothetical protein